MFRSRASALKPLRRYLLTDRSEHRDIVIYDKYVGRAAALLMALIRPQEVQTAVISEGGEATLSEHGILYTAMRRVKYLMGIASDGACQWEKIAIGKSPREFWDSLR